MNHIKNLFGTDGIRNAIGSSPFTTNELHALGSAIGSWLLQKYGPAPAILLAHDTRISCSWVKASLEAGMLMHPIRVFDAEVLPTPAVPYLLNVFKTIETPVACGIVISASHNAYLDNGIKIIDATHGKISAQDELAISRLFYEHQQDACCNHAHGHPSGIAQTVTSIHDIYIAGIIEKFPTKFLAGKKIVLDCAHGATTWVAPKIFTACGAEVITINNEPSGVNINENCGALHPEGLQKAVLQHHAAIGFAFDGDGDRVIAVSKDGVVKDGDDLIALLITHPLYAQQPTAVGTIMANQGFEVHITSLGKSLLRTPVGDKYVAEALEKHQLLVGGEQSGHIILRDYLNTGDGIFAALRICEALIATNNWAMKTFERYPQVLKNLAVKEKKDLKQQPLAQIIDESNKQLTSGRLVVRYSGTESLLRIMAEAATQEEAHMVVHELSEKLGKIL